MEPTFPLPELFWPAGQDEPTQPFDAFVADIRLYAELSKSNDKTAAKILRYRLGAEGTRVARGTLDALEGEAGLNAVVGALAPLFRSGRGPIVARLEFQQLRQAPGESVDRFAARLRAAARECEFDKLTPDHMLRDRLIAGTNVDAVRPRLIRDAKLTFAEALEIVRAQMTATDTAHVMEAMASVSDARPIHAVTTQKPRRAHTVVKACGACGTRHTAAECPAAGKTCHRCGKIGHFRNQCRSTIPAKKPVHKTVSLGLTCEGVELLSTSVRVLPSGKLTRFLIDSGSAANLIPEDEWVRIGSPKLSSADQTPRVAGYGGKQIQTVGSFQATLVHEQSGATATDRIIVSRTGRAVLGLEMLRKLGLMDLSKLTVNSTENTWAEEFPRVFRKQLGEVEGFQHVIRLKADAEAVQARARPIPLAIRDEVKAALDKLLDEGIIEPVESSEWLSAIHPVRKPNGKLRITADLRELNKAIVVERFPLPTIEQLVHSVGGSTHSRRSIFIRPITKSHWRKSPKT